MSYEIEFRKLTKFDDNLALISFKIIKLEFIPPIGLELDLEKSKLWGEVQETYVEEDNEGELKVYVRLVDDDYSEVRDENEIFVHIEYDKKDFNKLNIVEKIDGYIEQSLKKCEWTTEKIGFSENMKDYTSIRSYIHSRDPQGYIAKMMYQYRP